MTKSRKIRGGATINDIIYIYDDNKINEDFKKRIIMNMFHQLNNQNVARIKNIFKEIAFDNNFTKDNANKDIDNSFLINMIENISLDNSDIKNNFFKVLRYNYISTLSLKLLRNILELLDNSVYDLILEELKIQQTKLGGLIKIKKVIKKY